MRLGAAISIALLMAPSAAAGGESSTARTEAYTLNGAAAGTTRTDDEWRALAAEAHRARLWDERQRAIRAVQHGQRRGTWPELTAAHIFAAIAWPLNRHRAERYERTTRAECGAPGTESCRRRAVQAYQNCLLWDSCDGQVQKLTNRDRRRQARPLAGQTTPNEAR